MFRKPVIISCLILLTSCYKTYEARIRIDGSSTVFPVTEAIAEEFRIQFPDVKITVGVSGTGGGFKKLERREIDICNASRPISKEEIEACTKKNISFIELPVSYDGIAIVVSNKNNFVDHLTVSELRKIWEPQAQKKIKSWKQVRSTFPDVPLNLYGAGTSSGTYDYFTEAIVGKTKSSRGDYTASEDDNVLVQGVAGDKGALGYFGLAYYSENKDRLKLIAIDDESGTGPVYPNDSSIVNGTYRILSRPEFIYVNAQASERKEVQDFIKFYIDHAPLLVKEIGYIPLPETSYRLVQKRFEKRTTGSMFENETHVGINMNELLSKENE
jgi:phosphate transport system substrate-binding protein